MSKQKITAKQRAAKVQAAAERAERADQKKAAAEQRKKILTVVVCVILILALGLPTMALAVLGGA